MEKGITVGELIEHLKTLDPALECWYQVDTDCFEPATVEQCKIIDLYQDETETGTPQKVVALGDNP